MTNEQLRVPGADPNQITVSIPVGYEMPYNITLELMRHWTYENDGYNHFDIPLPLNEDLQLFLEEETLTK